MGTATDRKIVVIEVEGPRMSVVQMMPDGSSKRNNKELSSEREAQSACEKMAQQLISRGFVEQVARNSRPARSAQPGEPASKPAAPARRPSAPPEEPDEMDGSYVFADLEEEPVAAAAPVLTRLSASPGAQASAAPVVKKKKKGKKKKKAASGDGLDKRVLAGVAAFGLMIVGGLGYVVYDGFFKPPTIVGVWRGSMTEHETGKMIFHTSYDLILDDKHRAEMTIEKNTSTGTYSLKGNQLKLTFKDEDGETSERQYKVKLARSTLDLMDPESGNLLVQLIRFRETPVVGGKAEAPPAPTDLAGGDTDKIDKAAEDRLAVVEFSPKDNAFKLRHPQGWESDSGARPDNTYSWAEFTHDSAKIRITADIQGSLMSGSDSAQPLPEGSEFAPVQRAPRALPESGRRRIRRFQGEQARPLQGSADGRRPDLNLHRRRRRPLRLETAGLSRDAADPGSPRDDTLPLPRKGICHPQADVSCRLPQRFAVSSGNSQSRVRFSSTSLLHQALKLG